MAGGRRRALRHRPGGRGLSAPAAGLLTRRVLLDHLRRDAFRVGAEPAGPARVGIEVEWIPVDADTGAALPLRPGPGGGPATEPLLATLADRGGWTRSVSPAGAPQLLLPTGDALSLEPGGQIEFSSAPLASVGELSARLDAVAGALVGAAGEHGARLVARGVDPLNPVADARLEVANPRYSRMARHYDRYGAWGRRMMRQTAAIHVNLDLGPAPLDRWRAANAMAPVLLAAFANSPRCEGVETGHRSWRGAQWRRLDPSRTGVFGPSDRPVEAYLDFALGGAAFLLGPGDVPAEPFGRWLERGADEAHWLRHLTTLFPEVRPRGYLEVRSFDTLDPRWHGVPATLCVGALYPADGPARVVEALPAPDRDLLVRAGRDGLRDPELAAAAAALFEIAEGGAESLGPGVVGPDQLERLRAYRDRYVRCGRDPGDDPWDALGDAPPI